MHICKEFTFDAAHTIPGLPAHHKCSNLHGHTYKVQILVEGVMDDIGMIADYAEIEALWQPLHDMLDHKLLNEVAGLAKPTTEILAWWIYKRLTDAVLNDRVQVLAGDPLQLSARIAGVRVYESSTTFCAVP
jgi:6-pyruvoyltetrahydropterin/6-carboxytetrahydropterin synthase